MLFNDYQPRIQNYILANNQSNTSLRPQSSLVAGSSSKWQQSIQDIYRKTNQNLNIKAPQQVESDVQKTPKDGQNNFKLREPSDFKNIERSSPVENSNLMNQLRTNPSQLHRRPGTALANKSVVPQEPSPSKKASQNRPAQGLLITNPSYTRNTFLQKDTTSFNEDHQSCGGGGGSKFEQDLKLTSNNTRISKIEDRQRFFEEEIQKLLTLLQISVQDHDLKLSKIQKDASKALRQAEQVFKRTEDGESKQHRMTDQDIKQFIKNEGHLIETKCVEVIERCQKEIRDHVLNNDKRYQNLLVDSAQEFHSMKLLFEEMGESIYVRLSNEFSDRLSQEVRKFQTEFTTQLRKDSNILILDSLRSTEKQIMLLEGTMEDLKLSHDQAVEDYAKYQEHIDRALHRTKEDQDRKFEKFALALDKMNIIKDQAKSSEDLKHSLLQYVNRSEFEDQSKQSKDYTNKLVDVLKKEVASKIKEIEQDSSQKRISQIEKKLRDLQMQLSSQVMGNVTNSELNDTYYEKKLEERIKEIELQLVQLATQQTQTMTIHQLQPKQTPKNGYASASTPPSSISKFSQLGHHNVNSQQKRDDITPQPQFSVNANFIKIEDMNEEEHEDPAMQQEQNQNEVRFAVDDDDDDLEPNTVDYYNFSEPTKFDFQGQKPQSQITSSHHSRRNSPPLVLNRDMITPSPYGIMLQSKSPLSYLQKPLVESHEQEYQWEQLFTPVENVENIVDKFIENEINKAYKELSQ